jgi:CheY-like chemotaxis protein
MLCSTRVLIHDERPDTPEFLLEAVVNRGYKAGFAKDGSEIIAMLSNDQYNIVLTRCCENGAGCLATACLWGY